MAWRACLKPVSIAVATRLCGWSVPKVRQRRNRVDGRLRGSRDPQPMEPAGDLPAGFVGRDDDGAVPELVLQVCKGRLRVTGGAVNCAHQPAPTDRQAVVLLEQRGNLTERQVELLAEDGCPRNCVGGELHRGGPERIGRRQPMPRRPQRAPVIRTGRRQRGIVPFVDPGRPRPARRDAIVGARPAAGSPRDAGERLHERRGLTTTGSARRGQLRLPAARFGPPATRCACAASRSNHSRSPSTRSRSRRSCSARSRHGDFDLSSPLQSRCALRLCHIREKAQSKWLDLGLLPANYAEE